MSEPPATFLEFAETLPESVDVEQVLADFLDAARFAKDVFEINVAAGIAYNRLKGLDG